MRKKKYEKLGFEFEEIKTQFLCGEYRKLDKNTRIFN